LFWIQRLQTHRRLPLRFWISYPKSHTQDDVSRTRCDHTWSGKHRQRYWCSGSWGVSDRTLEAGVARKASTGVMRESVSVSSFIKGVAGSILSDTARRWPWCRSTELLVRWNAVAKSRLGSGHYSWRVSTTLGLAWSELWGAGATSQLGSMTRPLGHDQRPKSGQNLLSYPKSTSQQIQPIQSTEHQNGLTYYIIKSRYWLSWIDVDHQSIQYVEVRWVVPILGRDYSLTAEGSFSIFIKPKTEVTRLISSLTNNSVHFNDKFYLRQDYHRFSKADDYMGGSTSLIIEIFECNSRTSLHRSLSYIQYKTFGECVYSPWRRKRVDHNL
jgi:hypothetical protein